MRPELESKHTSVGLTLALTLALAVGLSLAPVPEAWRPIPSLARGDVGPQLLALVTTSSAAARRKAVGVEPDAEVNPPVPDALPEEDEPGWAEAGGADAGMAPEPAPVLAEAVTDSLGLSGLGSASHEEALRLEALREKLEARHVDLEPGCRREGPAGCEESGLAPFFQALRALDEGRRTLPVRVEHLGDSLIASDHITDVVRERLQERHGSGGKGFVYIDRPTRSGRATRAGQASPGWEIVRIIDRAPPRDRLPMSGVAFTAGAGGAQDVRFSIEDARTAELFFLAQPGGGSLQVSADGKLLQRVQMRWTPAELAFARLKLPEGARTLTLKTRGKVELHGVSLENGRPGVVYDTLGLPGAYAGVFLRPHAPFFRAQLRQRKPSLVVLMFGGNEAFRLSREWTKPEEIKQEAAQLVKRVRESAPDAACLVWSPIDAAVRTLGGELVPRRGSRAVAELFREVAREGGCAYWDALSAMGEEGSAIRWLSAGLLNEDLIHPRARGSDLLGHLFDLALQRAYAASAPPPLARVDAPGLQDADKALTATFTRLRALEKGGEGRLGILQLGTASPGAQGFARALRGALTKRFGDAGPGFVPAGPAAPGLLPEGVSRALTGTWTVEAAPWCLGGTCAVGSPDAATRIHFEGAAAPSPLPSARLSLYTLDGPGTGGLEVAVDGVPVPPEPPPPEPFTAPTVRVRSFPVSGAPVHEVVARDTGGGALTVLGAALDLERPGIGYDAVALPGAPDATLAGLEPGALAAQLSSRQPRLLVLVHGAHEEAGTRLADAAARAAYGALLARLKKDAGGAECLVLGLASGEKALAEVARDQGCASWSARAVRGPAGLTPETEDKLAELLLNDLLAAYESFKAQPPAVAVEGR